LRADPEIEFAEPDYLTQATFIPDDPFVSAGSEWHLGKIQAFDAWNVTSGSSNIIVAVLDSGVNFTHPDLAGRLLPGYDFVWNDADPSDDFGHGTAVTGTIVASGNNGIGVAGVAFGCSVLPVKVMDSGGAASHSAIAQGIEYAVNHGARVINLSMGGDWPSSTLQDAINFAWSNNVLVVASAGNTGGTAPQYPAACDHVLAVAASDSSDARAWFSTYGSFVSLYAPGLTIWTTQDDTNNLYAGWSGTSFASPIVAGVAALVVSVNPLLSNAQVVALLKQSADDVGPAGYDTTYSYGRINAWRAVNAAQTNSVVNPPPPLPPSSSPSTNNETVPPSVAILSGPADNSRLTTPIIKLQGSASDNVGLARVEVQLNEGPFVPAQGTNPWQASINLTAGKNVVRMRSVDLSGNVSAMAVRTYTFVVKSPLIVRTKGSGSVSPQLNGVMLEIGKSYQVKAVPAKGQIFAGWEGVSSSAAVLTFIMQSNLTLVAHFLPSPFTAVKGRYNGLVANEPAVTPNNSGCFALNVTVSGQFSGQITMAGMRQGFSGQFDLNGEASISVRRNLQAPLAVNLQVDLTNGTDQVSGSVSDGQWTSALGGDRNIFNSLTNPARQAGDRSFVLQRADNQARAASGLSKVSLNGATRVRGILTDGRAFATASALAKNGDCPFYLSLNHGNEVVIGWLNFPIDQGPSASGTVLWVRTGTNSFAATLQAVAGD